MAVSVTPMLTIRGGTVLLPAGSTERTDVVCRGPVVESVGRHGAAGTVDIDAAGALVLPGLVDIHGDGFERTVMPRPGVFVDVAAAVAETRSHLLAAGITTGYVSVTDGWEPGLRSRETLRDLVAALRGSSTERWGPELRLHVRHERCNTDDIDELLGWIADGSITMLSYNDHTPGGIAMVEGITELQVKRSGLGQDALEAEQRAAVARRELGRVQEERLARAAHDASIATASHDASSDTDLRRDLALGVDIAEFPLSIELAQRYRDAGIAILLGAPNLVRGHSHLGNLSVRDAWEAGVADLICSDYHYQSMLHAPFVLTSLGASLHEAWHTVSRGPAEAAGLYDRGVIEAGARADLIVVEPPESSRPARVRAVVVDGRLAALTP
ncbi:MAG: alpha-D-ribose 1-methylphosphonate 5-triphosphate diphosphatase [Acidimicrobiales bacterium]